MTFRLNFRLVLWHVELRTEIVSERRGTAFRQTIADLQERAAKLDSVIASSEAEPENDLIAIYNQGKKEITQKEISETCEEREQCILHSTKVSSK